MKEHPDLPIGDAAGSSAQAPSCVLDWRMLADQRLTQLVDIEHDYSVMRDRLNLLQVDYCELLVVSEGQLQRIWGLDKSCVELHGRLDDLALEYAAMQASRSWRLTQPLRALSTHVAAGRRGVGRLLRAILRVPLLRRVARWVVRLVPGLHARLRSRLHPHA
jgi:hypothetical protein